MYPNDPNHSPYVRRWGDPSTPYGPADGPASTQVPTTNSMAIAALVCSLLFPPLGIVFGHIARWQIRRSGEGGRGLALAALIISYVIIVLSIAFIVISTVILVQIAHELSHQNQVMGVHETFNSASACRLSRYC
jgi:hypothetical protein